MSEYTDKCQKTFQNTVECRNMQDGFGKYFGMKSSLGKYLKMSEFAEKAS